ncbi:MAG: alanine-tRNA synthetase second additional domain-containing protein [Clostridia bacterium]|nr:alanine-tRNA synthetase second additional domain-containing protein [Clostridia bacterium]MBR3460862.1 alanine-tRNA synthetase second additional domain-containing protein [Clostridia bacterium]
MPYSGRMQQNHYYSVFFAPRGRDRIYDLGIQIAQMYLSPYDKLIGIIGEAGSGKSMLIKGMFPGLELTNDDNGVNMRPLPIMDQSYDGFFTAHTYHLDIRFEAAFTQLGELADAILRAVKNGKRVIVEHFDLIYPILGINANLLIGVGEEVIITRPTIFGPLPSELHEKVAKSVNYRRMTHTAEDLCEIFMPEEEYRRCRHRDIKHGFLLAFDGKEPNIDLYELERKVNDAIAADLEISYVDEEHVKIGDRVHPCTGPRTHVPSTGHIEGFRLLHRVVFDPIEQCYLVAGRVGPGAGGESIDDVNDITLE